MLLRKRIRNGHGARGAHSNQQKTFPLSCAIIAIAAVLIAFPAYCFAANSGDEDVPVNSSANLGDETKMPSQPTVLQPAAAGYEGYGDAGPSAAPGTSAPGIFELSALPLYGMDAGPAAPRPCFLVVPGLCAAAKNRPILALATLQSAALIADGVTTRQYLTRGYVEVDPFARILLGRKPTWARMAPLGTVQVLAGMWLAERMQTSRHEWIRRLWWLPQIVGIAGNALATANNVRLR
jgi:hypothetical protein